MAPTPSDLTSPSRLKRFAIVLIGGFLILDSLAISAIGGGMAPWPDLVQWGDDAGTLASICALAGIVLMVGHILLLAWRSKDRNLGLNELVILAVAASIVRAAIVTDGVLALQTAGAVAFFMLVSMLIESQSAVGARASLEELVKLTPGNARVLADDGTETLTEPGGVQVKDRLRIMPGETVYADGVIKKGSTSLQEANITGESIPVDKEVGARVFAGTLNLSGLIEIEVERAGKDTTIGKVRELIMEAEKSRMPFIRLIDHYVRYYTPVIIMLSAIVWFAAGHDVDRVAALLVAACPLALILATPSVTIAALSSAARLGVLIKNVGDIERLAKADVFVMDKTGTVTKGQLGVVKMAPVHGINTAELLRVAAGVEQRSTHPVAQAIRELAEKARVKLKEPAELHEQPGRGVRASLEGCEIIAGNLAWMIENGVTEGDFPEHDDETQGYSLLYVMRDGKALGWIALEDQLREGAADALQALRDQGVKHLAIVTGDRKAVAIRVAKELGVDDFKAECVPSEKVDYVETMKEKVGRTVFVGDGVNDGPALAASHIGIAMGAAGSDVAMESATIALLNNRLDRLPFLLELAKRSRSVMIQNFVVGGIFIFGGMTLSAMGQLPPWAAAVIQALSSIVILMNSARLIRVGEELG